MLGHHAAFRSAVRPGKRLQQRAFHRVFPIDVLHDRIKVPLGDSPGGLFVGRHAPYFQIGIRLRAVATPAGAAIHQPRLDRLGEGFDRAARQALDHAVQLLVRRSLTGQGIAVGLRWLKGHFQPVLDRAQHRVGRVGGHGVGQLDGGRPQQSVSQTPLGQFQVLMHVAGPDGRPLAPVSVVQIVANQLDLRFFQPNLPVAEIDDQHLLDLRDLAFENLAVAKNDGPRGLGAQTRR